MGPECGKQTVKVQFTFLHSSVSSEAAPKAKAKKPAGKKK
jgi:hypothetical protein